jgi:hypothetical protein
MRLSLPRQKLLFTEKTEIWKKECVDAIITMSYNSNTNRRTQQEKKENYDITNGIINENDNLYVAVGAYHLLEPKVKFLSSDVESKIFRKYVANFAYSKKIGQNIHLVSVANVQQQGPFQELLLGVFTDFKKQDKNLATKVFRFGTLYRLNDSFIPTVKLDYPSISVSLSYDFPSNFNLMPYRFYGSFEISVITKGFYKNSVVGSKMCPRF